MLRRLSLITLAAVFAASSSLAMLQSARPALADPDAHHLRRVHHQRNNDHDRDDKRSKHKHHNVNWNNNGNHNGYWKNGTWYTPNGHKRRYDPVRNTH